jgi:hypothetical protein
LLPPLPHQQVEARPGQHPLDQPLGRRPGLEGLAGLDPHHPPCIHTPHRHRCPPIFPRFRFFRFFDGRRGLLLFPPLPQIVDRQLIREHAWILPLRERRLARYVGLVHPPDDLLAVGQVTQHVPQRLDARPPRSARRQGHRPQRVPGRRQRLACGFTRPGIDQFANDPRRVSPISTHTRILAQKFYFVHRIRPNVKFLVVRLAIAVCRREGISQPGVLPYLIDQRL